MPLAPGKSKKAFSHNVEVEMEHGKPQKQSLAIAYAVKRKAGKKKMAQGGKIADNMSGGTSKSNMQDEAPPSAKSESRPMPGRSDTSGKAPKNDSWTDRSTVSQAQKPSRTPLSEPGMVNSMIIKPKSIDALGRLKDDERHLQSTMPPSSPKDQPSKSMDELDATKQGPSIPSLKMKRMAKGGMLPPGSEDTQVVHPEGLESDNDQMAPPSKEYMAGYMAAHEHMMAEGGSPDKTNGLATMVDQMRDSMHAPHSMQGTSSGESGLDSESEDHGDKYAEGGSTSDGHLSDYRMKHAHLTSDQHTQKAKEIRASTEGMSPKYKSNMETLASYHENEAKPRKLANGGPVDDTSDIDLDEMEDERHSSIAAAIMAKRDRMKAGSDSDEDEQMMMAEGGDIKSHGSMDTHEDADQADLSRNADEDANEEDQASFDSLRKENYNESEGLAQLDSPDDSNETGDDREDEEENKHDMVGSIRRKMSMRRQFSK